MNDIESIKRKKLERLMQLQQQQAQIQVQQQLQEAQALQQQIEQLEIMIKPLLSKEAWQRYTTLRLAHPERSVQALVALAQLIQSGNIRRVLTDEEFKNVLIKLDTTPR